MVHFKKDNSKDGTHQSTKMCEVRYKNFKDCARLWCIFYFILFYFRREEGGGEEGWVVERMLMAVSGKVYFENYHALT